MKKIIIEYEHGDDEGLVKAIFAMTEELHITFVKGNFYLPKFSNAILDCEVDLIH